MCVKVYQRYLYGPYAKKQIGNAYGVQVPPFGPEMNKPLECKWAMGGQEHRVLMTTDPQPVRHDESGFPQTGQRKWCGQVYINSQDLSLKMGEDSMALNRAK